MCHAKSIIATIGWLAVASMPAVAQGLEGTLQKIKDSGTFTIGFRESSLPLSYLDDKQQPWDFPSSSAATSSSR